jgi:hypothetical protein
MISRTTRTLLALLMGFLLGLVILIINGRTIGASIVGAFIFSVLVGVIVAMLSWAYEYAERKGYSGWVGFFLILLLNIVGIILLLLLPSKITTHHPV